jgi:hypothetical protein
MPHGEPSGSTSSAATQATLRDSSGSHYASTAGTTVSSGSNPTPLAVRSTSNIEHSDSTSENERLRILGELEASVESFRRGKTIKMNVISSIIQILGENPHVALTSTQKESTFDSYLTEILAIQFLFDESNDIGIEKPTVSEQLPVSPIITTNKSSWRTHDDIESDSEDDSDKPTKKPKLLESDMPWYSPTDDSQVGNSDPSCKETRRLLRAYNLDISKAKFFVKVAPKSPPGIPSSQWEHILKGDAVDLNQI